MCLKPGPDVTPQAEPRPDRSRSPAVWARLSVSLLSTVTSVTGGCWAAPVRTAVRVSGTPCEVLVVGLARVAAAGGRWVATKVWARAFPGVLAGRAVGPDRRAGGGVRAVGGAAGDWPGPAVREGFDSASGRDVLVTLAGVAVDGRRDGHAHRVDVPRE